MEAHPRSAAVAAWEAQGISRTLCGREVFTVDLAATEGEAAAPLLVLHGFPTSSFDFHLVLAGLRRRRRVLLFDMCGYGLSAKPDIAYTIGLQADIAAALTEDLGITSVALLTHDVGDTVGGELLARQAEGRWPVEVTQRLLTNGSIYIDLAQLTTGQQLLLSLPDERIDDDLVDRTSVVAGLAGTFSPASEVGADELAAMWELIAFRDGQRLLPRLIRYIEERRAHEDRFTGAIEQHPSPLDVVWGAEDPVAVPAMTDRLAAACPRASITRLEGVGHYPMVEAPERFLAAVTSALG